MYYNKKQYLLINKLIRINKYQKYTLYGNILSKIKFKLIHEHSYNILNMLSNAQSLELKKAILEYLSNSQFDQTAKIFAEEAGLNLAEVDTEGQKLCLKWKSIISLTKKITNLEDQLKNMAPQNGIAEPTGVQSEGVDLQIPEKTLIKGHKNNVTSISFHPTFTEIASSSDDGTIKIWNTEDGALVKSLKGHTASVNCVNYDHQGKFLVSCSSDTTIKLWNLTEYQCAKTFFGHEHNVSCVIFIQDSEFILSCSRDKTIKLWEISTSFCKRTYQGHEDWVRQVVATKDSKTFASCSNDETIMVWNIEKEVANITLQGHEHVIETIIFAQKQVSQYLTGTQLLKSKFKKDLQSLKKLQQDNNVASLKATPLFLFSGSRDKVIKLYNCGNGDLLHNFIGHDNWVRCISLHPTGKFLYSVSDDKTLRIWDLNYGKEKKKLQIHQHFISTVRYNQKYKIIATAGMDLTIKIWGLK